MSHSVAEHVDMNNLIHQGIVTGHFPLHDSEELSVLSESWTAPWLVWTWRQPLDDVRAYFGEPVAFYFAFTGFQARVLLPLAVLGVLGEFLMHNLRETSNLLVVR